MTMAGRFICDRKWGDLFFKFISPPNNFPVPDPIWSGPAARQLLHNTNFLKSIISNRLHKNWRVHDVDTNILSIGILFFVSKIQWGKKHFNGDAAAAGRAHCYAILLYISRG